MCYGTDEHTFSGLTAYNAMFAVFACNAILYIYTISGAQLINYKTGTDADIHALIGHVVRQLLPAGEPITLHDLIAALHGLSQKSFCPSAREQCQEAIRLLMPMQH